MLPEWLERWLLDLWAEHTCSRFVCCLPQVRESTYLGEPPMISVHRCNALVNQRPSSDPSSPWVVFGWSPATFLNLCAYWLLCRSRSSVRFSASSLSPPVLKAVTTTLQILFVWLTESPPKLRFSQSELCDLRWKQLLFTQFSSFRIQPPDELGWQVFSSP
jgi:hypothetical protein